VLQAGFAYGVALKYTFRSGGSSPHPSKRAEARQRVRVRISES